MKSTWRIVALIVFVTWVSAFVACSAHCFLGTSHLGMAQQTHSCHAAPPPCHDSPAQDKGECDAGALCTTLKQMFSTKASVEVFPPPDFVLFDQPVISATGPGKTASAIYEKRQAIPSEFVFTPEVYLGVTNLPHAPPLLS